MSERKLRDVETHEWHAAISFAMLFAFGCVVFFGGHGVGIAFLIALPDDTNPGEPFRAAVWGSAFLLVASYFMSRPAIAAVIRVAAVCILSTVMVRLFLDFKPWRDATGMAFTGGTCVPFAGLALCELMLDASRLRRSMRDQAAWSFSIFDILLLTAAITGFVLPSALRM